MRRFVLAAVLLALCGCPNDIPGVTCSDGEPCEKGVCVEGICVDPNCTGCTALQDCVIGLCQDAFTGLEIVAPVAGATVAPRVEVGVEVKLLRWNASSTAAAPSEIKLVLQGPSTVEQSLAHAEGDLYRGAAVFPSAGSWTLMAKQPDAGVRSEKVAVEVVGCTPDCATPKEECVAGTCQPVLTGIALVEPAEAGPFGPTVPVAAEVLARELAYTALPEQVTLSATLAGVDAPVEVALTRTTGEARYTGNLTVTQSGTWTLTATVPEEYGDLASQPKSIEIDAKPPVLTLAVQYPLRSSAGAVSHVDPEIQGPYARRDEYVAILVTADEPVDFAQAELVVKDASNIDTVALLSALPAPEGAPTCPAGSERTCKVMGLKLWDPALKLPKSRGVFVLTASATDQVGNRGGSTPLDLAVSRFKWSVQLGGPLATSPALTADGNVVVAHGTSGSTGTQAARVRAIDPEATSILDVNQLSSLAPSRLLLAAQPAASDGALPVVVVGGKVQGSGGTDSTSGVLVIKGGIAATMCPGQFSEAFEIALVQADSVPYVVALVPGPMGGVRLAAAPLSAPGTCALSTDAFPKSTHPGIAVDGATVLVPGLQKLHAYTVANNGFTHTTPETGRDGQHLGPIVTRLGVAGVTTTFTDTVTETGSVFLAPGASADPLESTAVLAKLRGLVSGSQHKLVATSEAGKAFVFPDTLDAVAIEIPVSGPVSTWPTLGANGTAFFVGSNGVLEAKGQDESWTMNLDSGPGTLAAFSPALDCGRKGGVGLAGRPGVAYVGTQAGTLFAVITDSPGLDAPLASETETAERIWPKWAHDPQNTANADTSLAGHSCR